MYDVNSVEFAYYYQRSRVKVKQWEDQFKMKYGRIPTKEDIRVSNTKIKHYYKVYWKLKTKLLEETILGNFAPSENNNALARCKSDYVLKEHTNIINDKCISLTKTNNVSAGKVMKENNVSEAAVEKNESKTWGIHLNKTLSCPSDLHEDKTSTWNVPEKLFEGTSFKKRNPRKSLKRIDSKMLGLVNETTNNVNEMTNNGNSVSQKNSQSNMSFTSTETFSSFESFQTDLSPCSDVQDEVSTDGKCSVQNDCSPKIKALIMSETELSSLFAISDKVRVISEPQTTHSQPVSLVQKSAMDPKYSSHSARKLDAGWIERCGDTGNKYDQKMSHDSGFESMESSILGTSSELSKDEIKISIPESEDDDDIIGDSDNELDNSRLKFLPMKRKSPSESAETEVATANTKFDKPFEPADKKNRLDPYQFPAGRTEKVKKSALEIKKERLNKKIKMGTLNENYVKINIKKKVFVRGKKNFNYIKHKKQEWKKLKKNLEGEEACSIIRCYKCGDAGHYARYCQTVASKSLPDDCDFEEEEESSLPTLEEAEAMAREKANPKNKCILLPVLPEVQAEEPCKAVEPLYHLNSNEQLIETPSEVYETLQKFGHSHFRPGQEQAIMRILSGLSTLVTIATGGGKSLCYQLPAYLYAIRRKCITLVVSPLVSLMEDQVSGSSSFFKMGCLHTNQTPKQRQTVIDDAKNGKLFTLLLSPEAIVAGDNSSGLCNTLKSLPPIAFACIDEVHCLSQWSHNFRPSYLMLTKVLKEKLGIKTLLGLTATATISTISSITKELGIKDEGGVIKDIPLPDNLFLSVSRDENKDEALLALLKSPNFMNANAILIYCTRRDECERLAVLIRTIHNDPSRANDKKRLSWNAESYHAGMSSVRRKQVQKAFMKGNLRIVIATVAFGMGINKRDIRGVIHYNMPRNFESYVQEIGRAGRDGKPAHCHLFLDANGSDLNELRRHINSNAVDRHVMRKLLHRVFTECKCKEKEKSCEGHEVAFDCSDTVQTLDIPEENIYTLLCYLELHSQKMVKVLTPGFMNCKIQSYRGIKAILSAAKKCPPLAVACALNADSLKEGKNHSLNINCINVANAISWDSATVKSQLKSIEWNQTKDGKWKKSGIVVEFFDLGFRLISKGDKTPEELDEALDYLVKRVESQEKRSSEQLDVIFSALTHFSCCSYKECLEGCSSDKSNELKKVIRKYFEDEKLWENIPVMRLQAKEFDEDEVASDVRALICSYRDNSFNCRAVARIFHGIQSPNYPASIWYKCRYWRLHIDKDFNRICRIATKEILRFK